MKHNNFIRGFILITLLISCNNKEPGQKQPMEPKSYKTKVLNPQKIELQSVFSAVLKGREDIEIKPRIDGYIEKVYVDEGIEVKKGQPLFKINSPSSIKTLEEAQAKYNTAKLDVERMRPLADKDIISKVQLKAYENTLDAARAVLEQAKATMSWVTVTSPINGIVGTISYRLGSLVNSSTVLTTVANTSKIFAHFSMNEKEVYDFLDKWKGKTKSEKIKNMPSVKFILSNGTMYKKTGRIETISGVVEQTTGSVNIRAAFPNTSGLLLSGASGQVIIPEYIKNALVIPQKATFNQQNKTIAYKVQGDSVIQKVITVTPTPDGKNYVVLNGLVQGDIIVIDDIIRLSNGTKIKIQ